ncbi:MAG: inositol monophosphatase, partial [Candidatus Omnitrophica bacterium]|nr:inositol monophosphatase [Candidatus Omnitrophota bacterium]
HKFPFFCVSIGLEYRNDLIIGVVYDPEKGELFHAESGKGAFLNRKRIYVSEVTSVKKALLATGFAYNLKQARNKNINNFIKLLKASQAIRRAGSAALDLCYVACGRFDGFWELNLNPWDTAAGVVILKEAQGRVSALNGKKFNLYGKELLSSNSKIHNQLVRILSE